jgi:hypothetical protein
MTFLTPDTLYPGNGQGAEGVANFPDGPPADFATRPAGRRETEEATYPNHEGTGVRPAPIHGRSVPPIFALDTPVRCAGYSMQV